MKRTLKRWTLIVFAMALLLPAAAMATSNITVDFDAALTAGPAATWDVNSNSMLDSDELAVLAAILADTTKPNHDAIHAAWNTNRAQMATDLGGFDAVYGTAFAGYMTLGDTNSVTAVVSTAGAYAITVNPANYDLTCSPYLSSTGNADTDALTNATEYAAIAGTGGPSSAKRAQYVIDALTDAVPSTLSFTAQPVGGTIELGSTHTFSVTVANGTAPYTYQWQKDSSNVGTNSASYTATGSALGSFAYTCIVTDSAKKSVVVSDAAVLNVVPLGSLPVGTISVLLGLAGAFAFGGVRLVRKMKRA